MQNAVAASTLVVTALLMWQVLAGYAFTTELSLVMRRVDPVGFWSSLLQQCVAISLTAVFAIMICKTDWKKVYESTTPRRRG